MQTITSKATSRRQVAAVVGKVARLIGWEKYAVNLDLGGGAWDDTTEALFREHGVTNHVVDPYNRDEEHNQGRLRFFRQHYADTCTISNVLNVIKEPAARDALLWQAHNLVKPGGRLYVTVYEGDKRSRGCRTRDGWQANRPLKGYVREVRKVWPGVSVRGGMIVAVKEEA